MYREIFFGKVLLTCFSKVGVICYFLIFIVNVYLTTFKRSSLLMTSCFKTSLILYILSISFLSSLFCLSYTDCDASKFNSNSFIRFSNMVLTFWRFFFSVSYSSSLWFFNFSLFSSSTITLNLSKFSFDTLEWAILISSCCFEIFILISKISIIVIILFLNPRIALYSRFLISGFLIWEFLYLVDSKLV